MATELSHPLTSRTVVRGNSVVFDTVFVEADGTPLIPLDASLYPAVTITDSEGTVIDTGVGISVGDGRWQYQYMTAADASLSTDASPWRIDWDMQTPNGRVASSSQNFNVVDLAELLPTDRAYTQLVGVGCPTRLTVKFRQQQSTISLVLKDEGTGSLDLSPSIQYTFIPTTGWHVYFADTPAWTTPGQYLAGWTMQQTPISPQQTVVQNLRVVTNSFWFLQPSVRMVIDKVQKAAGTVYAYSDSDIYEYLERGMDIINSANPISFWGIDFMTNTLLTEHLVLAAVWHGLNAQYLTGEIDFNFSGQTVTLDNESRTQVYDTAISRLASFLFENSTTKIETVKKNMQRRAFVGASGIRPISWRQGPFVNRIGGCGSNLGGFISSLGIIR